MPACVTKVVEDMDVQTDTERLRDYRRMIVELLFAERNHVCSVCVANGDCELQDLAIAVGMDHVQLDYLNPDCQVDLSHERFGIDHNRCVLCTRCVRVCDEIEGAHTWDVAGRGHRSRVITDMNQPWGDHRDLHVMRQVRAWPAPPERSSTRAPRSPRLEHDRSKLAFLVEAREKKQWNRLRLATVWLGGCSGCHMSFLDLDEFLIDLAGKVDVVFTPFIDVKVYPENVDAVLVEGAVANEEHLALDSPRCASGPDAHLLWRLRRDRQRHGPAEPLGTAELVLKRVYVENGDLNAAIPREPGILPVLLDQVTPVHAVVAVDFYIPGCPPPASTIRAVLEQLIAGASPHLNGREIKFG